MYTCPVCGYDKLRRFPSDDLICPSCGTQFGYTDSGRSYEDLRRQWIADGMRWFSRMRPAPDGWDPIIQLNRAGFAVNPQVVNPQVTNESRREESLGIRVPIIYRTVSVGRA